MRWLLRLLVLAMLAGGAAAGAAWWWLAQPLPLAAPTVEVSIEPGVSPRRVADIWVEAGVQVSPRWLYEWFRWSGRSRLIRAGSYEIETGITPRQLLDKMVRGDEVLESVRLAEGSTFLQVREALASAPSLRPTTQGLSEAQVMAALGEPTLAAEGRFFPDTYAYSRGVSDLTVLKRAHAAMQRRLVSAWAERAADLPLKSMDDALVLASIVEKETGVAAAPAPAAKKKIPTGPLVRNDSPNHNPEAAASHHRPVRSQRRPDTMARETKNASGRSSMAWRAWAATPSELTVSSPAKSPLERNTSRVSQHALTARPAPASTPQIRAAAKPTPKVW
mgnify:CR=1 FL=1